MGTSEWCSHSVHYTKQNYKTEEDCFRDREAKSPWQYGQGQPTGTDVLCARIQNADIRNKCFRAFTQAKASWLEPNSPGCLRPGWSEDERCVGTAAFCASDKRKKAYGSQDGCLSYRESRDSKHGGQRKYPFLLPDIKRCHGDQQEDCIGTEAFCMAQGPEAGLRCLESREKPPFLQPESPRCGEQGVSDFAEPCVGTKAWCRGESRIRQYGSEEACIKTRDSGTGKMPWLEPADQCAGGSGNDTEACVGTERQCRANPSCFEGRELGPFLLASESDCASNKDTEKCIGTWKWCDDKWKSLQYGDAHDCFMRRAFDLRQFNQEVERTFKPLYQDIISRGSGNVTFAALLRSQVLAQEDTKNLTAEVHRSVKAYVEELGKREKDYGQAVEEYMKRVVNDVK